MNWNSYIARRRINEQDWLKSRGIDSKDKFVAALAECGVDVPSVEELERMFPAPVIKVKEEINESSAAATQGIDQVTSRSLDGEGDGAGVRPSGKAGSKLRS
jgi:hypothetical protein